MEEYTPESQEEKSEQIKRWFQDNLRIIVSIVIVVAIAGGIYSYSNRGKSTVTITDSESAQTTEDQNSIDTSKTGEQQTKDDKASVKVSPASSSQETENSFVETAGKGDSLTTLARQATANYLEKNPDSALTKEHKIYVEDYLRKNITHKGGVRVGTSVEFSKDLVQKAISQSKNLNERQLKNLQKYSARVSNL
ncbi:MAG: hypothetical protein HGA61_05325 [Candidatus Moranbacteria bacterium]|nr:hypothetical protein [Candidatus Moranbacteria bacterium]